MRSKNPELMKEICTYVSDYYRQRRSFPSVNDIAKAVGIAKTTAYRYLVDMNERGMISYDGRTIETPQINRCIYLYNFGENKGSIQSGLRPVLVIQDNRMNANSPTTIVAAITTAAKKLYLPSHVFLGQEYGLDQPSMVMMEQIRVVNQADLSQYIGQVSDDHTKRIIANSIKKTMGLWNYEPKDKTTIRCLCPRCLEAYKESGEYVVRRLDPFQKAKDNCDLCGHTGWDYVITKRKHTAHRKIM